MNGDLLQAIPEPPREIARAALAAMFGTAALESLQPLSGGVSALTYQVAVSSRSYLLRLDVARDPLRHPQRGYECMRIAAAAGIAPRLHYANADQGVAIMDFVEQRPLNQYPGGGAQLAQDLGGFIARLQATPVFPPFGDYLQFIARIFGFIRGSRLFAAGILDPHAEAFEKVRAGYPSEGLALVSSHNDPNPRNVLFDGERLWLIDWETAFRNDPLVDIAVICNEFAASSELSAAVLRAWLGRAPDARLQARLLVMRQLVCLYYSCLLLAGFAMAPDNVPDGDLGAPSVEQFTRDVAQGRIVAGARQTTYILGKMYLGGFLAGCATAEVATALQRLGER
jgi:aminoglycoside phosphotransferase (APT) family kinase protein